LVVRRSRPVAGWLCLGSRLKAAAWLATASAFIGGCAGAQGIAPPFGYSGKSGESAAAASLDPGAPSLSRIADATLSDLFRIDPSYPRAAAAHAKVVGAFVVEEPAGTHLAAASARGFLPVTLAFSDGRCFTLEADYRGGTLSNGRLASSACDTRPGAGEPRAPPPAGRSLRFIDSAWGYDAWGDDGAGLTIVTAPFGKSFQPLFTARMAVVAITAMNLPDAPAGNVTLVGRTGGRLLVVTLEVTY
jgi:hypothetical protein